MIPDATLTEWEQRHVKVEDVIFDGPVCRTCRHIDGAAVSYPCDAAIAIAEIRWLREHISEWHKGENAGLHREIQKLIDDLAAHHAMIRELVEALDLALQFAGPRVAEGEVSTTEDWNEWDAAWKQIEKTLAHPLIVAAREGGRDD